MVKKHGAERREREKKYIYIFEKCEWERMNQNWQCGKMVMVPVGPWPGSEGASGAERQRGRGWPAGVV